jgi:hypothetical protein
MGNEEDEAVVETNSNVIAIHSCGRTEEMERHYTEEQAKTSD